MATLKQSKVLFGVAFMCIFSLSFIHHETIRANMPILLQQQLEKLSSLELLNSSRLEFIRNFSLPTVIPTQLVIHNFKEDRQEGFALRPKHFLDSPVNITEEQRKMKKILIWHHAYGKGPMGFGYGSDPFKLAKCKEDRCFLTRTRDLVPQKEFDAIIMHFRQLNEENHLPARSPNQRWIFYEMESASYVFENPGHYNNLFNWTMTYRRDSDIWARYGAAVLRENPLSELPYNTSLTASKTKMAAWFVSNCRSMSWRENLVKEMQKNIQVDIYGKCGPFTCTRKESDSCNEMLERDYKFYLSFENSFCRDYFTEKLFRPLRYQIIPVVYGNVEYDELIPEGSYIDVRDFENTTELTDYLIYLSKNTTAYNEYFLWKKDYKVLSEFEARSLGFCDLCEKLHNDHQPKVYQDMHKWFIKEGNCTRFQPRSWIEHVLNRNLL